MNNLKNILIGCVGLMCLPVAVPVVFIKNGNRDYESELKELANKKAKEMKDR